MGERSEEREADPAEERRAPLDRGEAKEEERGEEGPAVGAERRAGSERGEERPAGKYRGEGSLAPAEPNRSSDAGTDESGERDLEETLDRQRHGSGEYDPEERYGRQDVVPDREHAGPGDEDEPDTAEGDPKRGTSPRKQDPS